MGGDAYHNLPEHYEAIAGLFAGPVGCNVTVTDDLPSQTRASLSGYDLIVLWSTIGHGPAEAIGAIFDTVRTGTPLIGLHAAPYTVRMVNGGPEAIGSSYIKRFPHLPYQTITVDISDVPHPVTSGINSFVITDELYCLEHLPPEATVLATYDGRAAEASYVIPDGREPNPAHADAHAWRVTQPRAPLVYTKPLGNGHLVVNALGHDGQALTNPGFRQLTVQAAQWLLSGARPS
jgi:type 1 glutamine amidotransferase